MGGAVAEYGYSVRSQTEWPGFKFCLGSPLGKTFHFQNLPKCLSLLQCVNRGLDWGAVISDISKIYSNFSIITVELSVNFSAMGKSYRSMLKEASFFTWQLKVWPILSCQFNPIQNLISEYQLISEAPVHTTPAEFENGGFTLKTHEMFSVYTSPEEQLPVILDLFEENSVPGETRSGRGNHMIVMTPLFHTKTKSRCFQILSVCRAFYILLKESFYWNIKLKG